MFDRRRAGGLAWLCAVQFFGAEAFAAAAVPGYSYRFGFISDLGAAMGSPRQGWMNASFVLQGGLIVAGVAGGRDFPLAARVALVVCALGAALVGLAPEDVAPGWHYLGAAANLVGCNIGALLSGLGPGAGRAARAGIAAGAVGLAACVALGAHAYGGLGVGTVERLAAYPFVLWLAANGAATLLGDGGPGASRATDLPA
jgi:hypothetical membrane protein